MPATGQEMVREKKFKVREISGSFILGRENFIGILKKSQGKLKL